MVGVVVIVLFGLVTFAHFSDVYPQKVNDLVEDVIKHYDINTIVLVKSMIRTNSIFDDFLKFRVIRQSTVPIILQPPFSKKFLRDKISVIRTLLLIFLENDDDRTKEDANTVVTGMRSVKTIFFLSNCDTSTYNLKSLFNWCWQKNFINAAVIFSGDSDDLQIYTYTPFPKIIIQNVTSTGIDTIFYNKLKNLNGYTFRSPVKQDFPRVFKDNKRCKGCITGTGGRLLLSYFKRINGTFKEVVSNNYSTNVNIQQIFELLYFNAIDISIHPYGHFSRSLSSASYPMEISNWCLMLPIINEIPAYVYLILPFQIPVWNILALLIFIVTVVQYVVALGWKQQPEISRAFCNTIRAFLYTPIPYMRRAAKWQIVFIFSIFFVQSFMISNLYLAALTSFFTKTVYGTQILTVEDVIKSGLKIMIEHHELQTFLKTWNFPKQLLPIIIPVDPDTLVWHRDQLNTSFAYPISSERWSYLAPQEQYLRHRTMRLSNICFGYFILAYPMQLDSPFMESLKQFIILSSEVGIYQKLKSETFKEGVEAGLVDIHPAPEDPTNPISFTHLALAWHILYMGFMISLIAFAGEHLRHFVEIKKLKIHAIFLNLKKKINIFKEQNKNIIK